MATALLGAGYTGSYIFSQTVFTLRAGVLNRLNGLVVALVELFVFMLPFSVVRQFLLRLAALSGSAACVHAALFSGKTIFAQACCSQWQCCLC